MADNEQIEGLKLVGGWFKWIVAIQSAGIGLIASIIKDQPSGYFCHYPFAKWAFVLAIISFIASITVAVLVVCEIPTSITSIPANTPIWGRKIFWFGLPLSTLEVAANTILILFLVGISAFGSSLIELIVKR